MAELSEIVANAVEEVGEEVFEQSQGAAKVVRSLTKVKMSYMAIGVAAGSAVGALISWQIAYRRASKKYDAIAQAEIVDMRKVYKARTEAFKNSEAKAASLQQVVTELGYREGKNDAAVEEEEVEEASPIVNYSKLAEARNVFEEAKPTSEWDYATEVKSRSPQAPYIIHVDEHEQNEEGYEQVHLTFYEDDGVLSDNRDTVVDVETVGADNLTRFGHGSQDANIVYIRNDRLGLDLEVVRSTGSYAEEVHGFKHSDEPRRRRVDWDG